MKNKVRKILMILSCLISLSFTLSAQNPYLPLWEFIPDGEPYVFEDPDCPGKYRVYIYGSHDNLKWMYCGRDQVVWSAPIEDLTRWRYDGVIFKVNESPELYKLNADGTDDVLFAPDVTVTTDADGKKTYYLFPNNQGGGRNSMIAKSDRPDGPFTVCNWHKERPRETFGCLGFDPAVFVDDDGRVYGYWGFGISHGAELDPATMCTVKPGTEVVENMISGYRQEGIFRFFEASSIRKIEEANRQLMLTSRHDKLTGLLNRAAAEKLISEHLDLVGASSSYCFLLLDIDYFKSVNDRFGHLAGDSVLQYMGSSIRKSFRSGDVLCRWGGDEFVIFLRGVRSREIVRERLDALRARLLDCRAGEEPLSVTLSIGGAFGNGPSSLADLYSKADKALYQVKQQGRNGTVLE